MAQAPNGRLTDLCAVPGCGNPTMRAAGKGLAHFHCKRHVEHLARHGSLWHPTYLAKDLKPYLTSAEAWLKANRSEPAVAEALRKLGLTLAFSGRVEIVPRLRGLAPKSRANIALARVREAGIKPERLLTIALGTAALIEDDPASHRSNEFRIVQTAKQVHRLASGYHRTWDFPLLDGTTAPYSIHAYPRSSGRVLRHLGAAIEKDCGEVVAQFTRDVVAFKLAWFGRSIPHM